MKYEISTSNCSGTSIHFEEFFIGIYDEERTMLSLIITLLVIALIAGILGFGGIAGAAVGIAKIVFFVFLVLFVLSLIFGGIRGFGRRV